MSDLIKVVNELSYIREQLVDLNTNFVAAQAPPTPVVGRLTKRELHVIFESIQKDTDEKLEEKTGWGRNEVKQLIAQALWNADLTYEYRKEK